MLTIRRLFPYLVIVLLLTSLAWAVSFGTLPPADFTFNNDGEVKTIDPASATGQPENRIINGLFEGLVRMLPRPGEPPDAHGLVPLYPTAGCAELPEISPDGRTYTFRIRKDARWSNGDPVTSHDFAWSWRRTLHPDTAAVYAYQLYYIHGAKEYNRADLPDPQPKPDVQSAPAPSPESGADPRPAGEADAARYRVEIELNDRPDPLQPFPRGTILRGTLRQLSRPPAPQLPAGASEEEASKADVAWRKKWVYVVDVDGEDTADGYRSIEPPRPEVVATSPEAGATFGDRPVKVVRNVLPDFERTVAIQTPDPHTLVVRLTNPTPFFQELVAFYPYFPVHRGCVEKFGTPYWTKPGRIVSNGPFVLETRRLRDRIRMAKNPRYWGADDVQLRVIDAMAIQYKTTALSMFLKGQLDWITKPPTTIIKDLEQRSDLVRGPAMITYFYRLNVSRKPLDDARVRRALNLALDKQSICERVTRAGERPARSLVPPGMQGYTQGLCGEYDVAAARQLLAEAGYPGGSGFPRLQILFNTDDAHREIAEVIQQQWKENLGIELDLRNLEWSVYLDSVTKIDFDIARAGWVPDYTDPNTFLDMFVTGGAHNNTNWSNKEYDQLIEEAAAETDTTQRLEIMHRAEQLLMDELPIIPIYSYVTLNMVNPRVHNFSSNGQDLHPLQILRVDDLRSAEPATGK